MEISNRPPLVSVIVPVYNVEQYLAKCVDSILNQTYRNLEIILVDDGSPDGCPAMCDAYAEQDQRIKVIHKTNGGLSDARNAGLDAATGEYVTFIDSDDWYAADAIETLLSLRQTSHARIACMRNVGVSTDYRTIEKIQDENTVSLLSSHELLKELCEKKYSTSVGNKLFEADLFIGKRFENGRLNEDFRLLGEMLMDDFQVAKINYPGYFYYNRPGGITHSAKNNCKPVCDAMQNALELKEISLQKAPKLEKHFARMALYQARTLLIIMPDNAVNKDSEIMQRVVRCLNECKGYIFAASLKLMDKLILTMALCNPVKTSLLVHKLFSAKHSF